jgi:amidase
VSLAGACGLGPSFDTAGWFAARAGVLAQVGEVLLPEDSPPGAALGPLLKVEAAWINALPSTVVALAGPVQALEALLGRAVRVDLAPEGLSALYEHFRCAQAEEAWATLGSWVAATEPSFGPGVKERFAAARAMDPAKAAAGRAFRRGFQARMRALLAGGAVLVYPTSPVPAPKLSASQADQNAARELTMGVTAIAGLAGLCEVSVPAGRDAGAPVGLSLVAAAGRDRALLALACRLAEALSLPV